MVVLAGFLGAGKTTALNHLLAHADGRRIGVLVNDFGAVDIDSLLVSGAAGGTVTLPGGCICCTTDADGLGDAIAALSAPSAGLDAIVIEASGIAEPGALIRLVLAATGPTATYGGLVYLVDLPGFAATLAEFPAVCDHLAVADLVLCNKADLVDDAEAAEVRALVAELNPTAPALLVEHAAIDPALLFDDPPARSDDPGPRQLTLDGLLADESADDHSAHLHAAFESASLDRSASVDPRRLARFLERPPAGAYRIKGEVFVDLPGHADRVYVVQAVGGIVRVSVRRRRGEPGRTRLVVIGAGLDPVAADAALAEVIGVPDPADENGILHLTRYLADAGSAEQRRLDPLGVDPEPSADHPEGVDEP